MPPTAGIQGSGTAVNSGINTTSRFGFRGSEDIGQRAIFNLESGVNIDTGAPASATTLFDPFGSRSPAFTPMSVLQP